MLAPTFLILESPLLYSAPAIKLFAHRHARFWHWERNEGISTSNFEVNSSQKIHNKSDGGVHIGTQKHTKVLTQVLNVVQRI